MQNENDFSDIPALGDAQGLSQFMQRQDMAAAGLGMPPAAQPAQQAQAQPQVQPQVQPQAQPQPALQAQTQVQPQFQQQAQQPAQQRALTDAELAGILARVDAMRQAQRQGQLPLQRQGQPQQRAPMYSQEEVSFINTALQQGYSMEAIQSALNSRRAQAGRLPQVNDLEQRLDRLQQHIETQEYKAAEAAFVDKLTEFGNKFGLSEQDLVTFGQTAYSKGINIAVDNVDLETVFRAVFPEQYAIRSRRIAPANSSQIYGGSSAAEPTGAQAQKAAAEYAKQYLLGTMPNYPRNK